MPRRGGLPEEGQPIIGSQTLPTGRLVYPALRLKPQLPVPPALWASDDILENPGRLLSALRATDTPGLVAVLLEDLSGPGSTSGRPWKTGELVPRLDISPGDYRVDDVFRDGWKKQTPVSLLPPEDKEQLPDLMALSLDLDINLGEDDDERSRYLETADPWGVPFPGLALAERGLGDTGHYQATLDSTPPARLGLVAAHRLADVPHAIGWLGATNHFMTDQGPTLLSVMMRSWEERFGATLYRLGFDTMEFLVERPPPSEASALAVAAEHFAFAGSDGFSAYTTPISSIRTLARAIEGSPTWRFWWD
jgi:hypothetical protein